MWHNRWFGMGGPAIALLALLFVAGDTLAQRGGRGGGRGGGGGGSVARGSGSGGRGSDGRGWNGRGWNGGRSEWRGDGWGWGNGWYDRRGWYDPWGYDGYAYGGYPADYYSFYGSPDDYGSPGGDPTDQGAGAQSRMDDNAALIAVRVPPDAEIWFDGQKTSQTGPVRYFETSPLEPGHEYSYEIRARWNENGREVARTRKAIVHPGDRLALNFVHRQNGETPTPASSPSSSED
jgi:uncharacterized protein (TIGR03000 family)